MTKQQPTAQELRREMLQRVEQMAEREFADTRFDWLRSLPRRRALVVVCYTTLVLYGIGVFGGFAVLTLVSLIAYMATLWLLRLAVRSAVDLPEEVVDERMRAVRGVTYREAFIGTMVLMSAYLMVYIGNALLAKQGVFAPITADQLHELAFVMFFAALALPGALYAWRERHV
ncbi:MAG: hypothetical protein AAF184_06850 [Pseudomonadota bacterium]